MRASKQQDSTPTGPSPGPDMRLCLDELETIMRIAGWSNAELARQTGLDQSAVQRLREGKLQLGRRSIAGLLVAVRRRFGVHVCLCGLFEIIDADGEITPLRDPEQMPRAGA